MGKILPKWLTCNSYTLSSRPRLKIDEIEDYGTALDTARGRPSQRYRNIKKAKKRLVVAEEWINFITSKKS